MLRLRHIAMWIVAAVVLLVINGSIIQKELLIANGQPVYLELAPVDPRSLMQGDYMILNYAIATEIEFIHDIDTDDLPRRGKLVLHLNDERIAQFSRIYQAEEPLAGNEILFDYYVRNGDIWLGAESFFFQEGQAEVYEAAEYAELRVTAAGESVLVGLRGEQLKPLPPETE